jgi:hypothetical protein
VQKEKKDKKKGHEIDHAPERRFFLNGFSSQHLL